MTEEQVYVGHAVSNKLGQHCDAVIKPASEHFRYLDGFKRGSPGFRGHLKWHYEVR